MLKFFDGQTDGQKDGQSDYYRAPAYLGGALKIDMEERLKYFGIYKIFQQILECLEYVIWNIATNVLPMFMHTCRLFFDCRDIIIKCGQKVAHIENNGLGRWLNAIWMDNL